MTAGVGQPAFGLSFDPHSGAPARSTAHRTAGSAPSRTQPRASSHPLNARNLAYAP